MTTAALKLAQTLQREGRSESLSFGPVELQVTDMARAGHFWKTALGLVERASLPNGAIELGTAIQTLIVLHPGARQPVLKGYAGLYHVAIGMPTQKEFSRFLHRLIESRTRVYPVDHTMSKALYLADPDGHGIEIAYETPHRFSHFVDNGGGFGMIDADGNLKSGRDALDIRQELAFAPADGHSAPISDEAFVAHLHIHVPELNSAVRFYEKLGFARNLFLPEMGIADLGAGGKYTHRIALNIWNGPNVQPPPTSSARLLGYTLFARGPLVLQSAREQLGSEGDGPILVRDVAGVDFSLRLSPHAASEGFPA